MDTASKFINKVLQNRPNFKSLTGSKDKESKSKKKKPKSGIPVSAKQQDSTNSQSQSASMNGDSSNSQSQSANMNGDDAAKGPTDNKTDDTEKGESNNGNDEEIDIGPTDKMTEDRRNKLFERGVNYDKQGKRDAALKCYMGCLQGLQHDTRFPLLPVCLRNIADIFYQKEEYDKAIHFVQAEKVYYESALIDTEGIQKKIEDIKKTKNLTSEVTEETIKADEFEELARALLDKKQPRMALEYAGKATKIRQQVLGDNHEVTKRSLDFFATVYAEAGQEQYQDSLNKYSHQASVDDSVLSSDGEQSPKPILRNRKSASEGSIKKQVSFDEAQLQNFEKQEREERCAKLVLWLLFIICFVLLLILASYLYCHMTRAVACTTFRTYLEEMQKSLRFYWYKYSSTGDRQYV